VRGWYTRRVLRGTLLGLGLGALAGAAEVLCRSLFSLRLMTTVTERMVFTAAGIGLYAVAGALAGLGITAALGGIVGNGAKERNYRRLTGRDLVAAPLSTTLALTGAGLFVLVFLPSVADHLREPGGTRNALALLVAAAVEAAGIGFLAYRFLSRRDREEVARSQAGPFAGAFLACAVVVSVFRPSGGDAGRPAGQTCPDGEPCRDLVVVTLDTVRADRLGLYGGRGGGRTPELDAFGREATVFATAIAPQPETGPSHATMFTGLHPLHHGLTSNAGVLPPGPATLAELLRRQGYATGAFVSAYALDSGVGVGRGFDTYDDDFARGVRGLNALSLRRLWHKAVFALGSPAKVGDLERPAPATVSRALEWLDHHQGERVFLWVHLFDAHAPYVPHGIAGYEANGRPGAPTVDHTAILDARRNEYRPEEVEALKRLYAEEVAYVDAQVGALLAGLRERGVLERAVVAVLADHGESMDDHGIFFSHNGLYDTVLKVPLILKAPGGALPAGRVESQVRVQDLFPTLLELLGFPLPGKVDGSSLVPLARGEAGPERQALVIGRMGHIGTDLYFGIRSDEWKYIRAPDGAEEFYRVRQDPCEQRDAAGEQPRAVEAARQALQAVVGDRLAAPPAPSAPAGIDPEEHAKLVALGYMDPGTAPVPRKAGPKPVWVCDAPAP